MTNDANTREQLVENRKSIADEAKKLADSSDKKFLIDAGFTGFMGTALTTIFGQYEGSGRYLATLGAASATIIASSHIKSSYNKDFYLELSKYAEKQAFEFKNGKAVENEEEKLFEDYKDEFIQIHKRKFSTLLSFRSATVASAAVILTAFALAQDPENRARKEEDLEDITSTATVPSLDYQK